MGGGLRPIDIHCGFTIESKVCGKKPVIRHMLFVKDSGDEEHRSGYACEYHENVVGSDVVLMYHPVGLFCSKPDSVWSFEVNECIVTYENFELALLGTTTFAEDIIKEIENAGSE